MRVNIYAEEITDRVEIVTTHVEETNATFIGIRFFLKTHEDMLMPKHPDNDDSAVTFWVKSGKYGFRYSDAEFLIDLFNDAAQELSEYADMKLIGDK
jgi:hypothetical protein